MGGRDVNTDGVSDAAGQTLPPAPSPEVLAVRAAAVLGEHWQPQGYSVPHAGTYPHQWLWDSCFHAIVWLRVGEPDRAIAELRAVFAHQQSDGFVPHMTYWSDPDAALGFWGRRGTSCITQPPMYGHAIAELVRAGIAVPDDVLAAAHHGLRYLLDVRTPGGAGGVRIVHPWESGCDDSIRWDRWCAPQWTPQAWRKHKAALVAAIVAGDTSRFAVEPASFTALVAFNARELAGVGFEASADARLASAADDLAVVLANRWDSGACTWADVDPGGQVTSVARTLDALLGTLVVDDAVQCGAALDQLTDPAAFAAPFGPAGAHRTEPGWDPDRYWRGPSWPQLSYLVWLAARRWRHRSAPMIAGGLVSGAVASGWGEYWNPDTGSSRGAAPQSWTGVAAVVAAVEADSSAPQADWG